MKISSIFYGPINATILPSFPSPFSFLKAKCKRAAVRSLSAGPSEPRFLYYPSAVQPREQVLSTLHVHSGQHGRWLQKPQSNRRDRQSHRYEPGANWSVDSCWGSTEYGGKLIILGVGEMDQRRPRKAFEPCLNVCMGSGRTTLSDLFFTTGSQYSLFCNPKKLQREPKKK